MRNMKSLFAILFVLMAFTACSEDDNNVEPKEPNPNVSAENLENKSGGVYFAATPAGEYIFRIALKNGNDKIICQMFHEDSYSMLSADDIPDWEPGEELTGVVFSNEKVALHISLQEDGTETSQLFIEQEEIETVSFKSTQDTPVQVYSGHTVSYETKGGIEEGADYTKEMMILQNENYFYGLKADEDNYYRKVFSKLKDRTSTHFTYDVPDSENGEYTWERIGVQYDEELISWSYEDENPDANEYFSTELNLFRRFKN